jgi:hypothetical protein
MRGTKIAQIENDKNGELYNDDNLDGKLRDLQNRHHDVLRKILDEAVDILSREVEQRLEQSSCVGCGHFEASTERCAVAKVRPPLAVIFQGCERHTRRIPF